MIDRSSAEEDLRVIRTLMERAASYRAISAPTALAGGLLSLLSAAFIANSDMLLGRTLRAREFAIIWIVVLGLTMLLNVFFVSREARNSGRPFVSSGMKLALRAIAPTLIVPAIFTVWFLKLGYFSGSELELVTIWIVFYGLALLSTALFAPRSLALLGWAFLLTGVSIPVTADAVDGLSTDIPNFFMGITFGAYHLIYAVFAWPRKERATGEQPVPE
jgi:hypothetical protein